MEDGVLLIFRATNLMRPGSTFHCLADEHDNDYLSDTSTKSWVDGLPSQFVGLYELMIHLTVKQRISSSSSFAGKNAHKV